MRPALEPIAPETLGAVHGGADPKRPAPPRRACIRVYEPLGPGKVRESVQCSTLPPERSGVDV